MMIDESPNPNYTHTQFYTSHSTANSPSSRALIPALSFSSLATSLLPPHRGLDPRPPSAAESRNFPISFQFHHAQMDGSHAARFLEELQKTINTI